MSSSLTLTPDKTIFFVCDIQTRFRAAIHGFEHVVTMSQKLLKLAKTLDISVMVTEQNSRALGSTVPELVSELSKLDNLHIGTVDKTVFSMVTPQIKEILHNKPEIKAVVVMGIEAHVCVLQTALDLLALNYIVYIPADAVSSCNADEVPLALARVRQAGGLIGSSESLAFELMHDAADSRFKVFSGLIKEEKERTGQAMEALLKPRSLL